MVGRLMIDWGCTVSSRLSVTASVRADACLSLTSNSSSRTTRLSAAASSARNPMTDAADTAAENKKQADLEVGYKFLTYPSQRTLIAARKAPEAGFVAGA
jgi:hypothetical protein